MISLTLDRLPSASRTSNHMCQYDASSPDPQDCSVQCQVLALPPLCVGLWLSLDTPTREQTTQSCSGFCCLPRKIELEITRSASKEKNWGGRFMLKNCEKVLRLTFQQGLKYFTDRNIKWKKVILKEQV